MTQNLLPKGRHKPRSSILASRHMIQGLPKVGKTTFANSWPKPLFLATEPGTHLLQAAETEINSWDNPGGSGGFIQVLDQLAALDHPYETIILDTVDNLYSRCQEHVCQELGVTHVSDKPYKGWDILKSTWTKGIHRLASLRARGNRSLCSVFIGHTKLDPIKEKRGSGIVDTGLHLHRSALPPAARGILHSAMDFLYGVEVEDNGTRWLITQPTQTKYARYECGSRGEPGRMLPERIPMNYAALSTAFEETFGEKK